MRRDIPKPGNTSFWVKMWELARAQGTFQTIHFSFRMLQFLNATVKLIIVQFYLIEDVTPWNDATAPVKQGSCIGLRLITHELRYLEEDIYWVMICIESRNQLELGVDGCFSYILITLKGISMLAS